MAKKEKELQTHLKPEQYWEMREAMEEMLHAKTQSELILAKYRLMEKDIEIGQLRASIYKATVQASSGLHKVKTEQYEKVREKIEGQLGYSLKSKAIDEVTFQVNDIPGEETK